MKKNKKIIIIFGDQLSHSLSSLHNADPHNDVIIMMEVLTEATYVKHHLHKIIFIFSAMRHFCDELKSKGFTVYYLKIDDENNKQSFTNNFYYAVSQFNPTQVSITEPGEYRVLEMIYEWQKNLTIPINILSDTRFLCSINEFTQWAKDKTQLRMEFFYRYMRIKTNTLMKDNKPEGGKFNYDKLNRLPPRNNMHFSKRISIEHDQITKEVINSITNLFKDHMGLAKNFNIAVTRKDALIIFHDFIKNNLPHFGDFQDAMINGEYFLHHSMISMYLNIGLLTAEEVITEVQFAYYNKRVNINSAEGYIRQILGWREFVRGVYWLKMPEYKNMNYFGAKEKLPWFYWTGNTDMACLKHTIQQTIETATSHHIQRLMVTGNFAILLGVLPEEVCEWYLAVYVDAFEWVELPNTLGMSQFADGGIVASKPYVSSGNYINKMSNFCQTCPYSVKEKLTENACPYNDLYWAFLIKNKKKLQNNPRLAFAYKTIDKMELELQKAYLNKQKILISKFCGGQPPS